MKKFELNVFVKNKMIPALLSIALGIVMIIARRAALDLMVKIIGGLIVTGGIAFLAYWLFGPGRNEAPASFFAGPAVVMILVGLALIFFASTVVDIFPMLMGIVLILNGLSHLTAAGMAGQDRFLLGLLGVVTIVLGILIVAKPGFVANAIMIWIGAFFIVNGVFDLLMVKRFTVTGNIE